MEVQKDKEIQDSGDALRQGMLQKIQEKKLELFSLQKVKFDEGIEMVMQQNSHYESQLDYQTKNLESLILRNESIQHQNLSAKGEIMMHQRVQQELVRKVFLSDKLGEELREQSNETQQNIQDVQERIRSLEESIAATERDIDRIKECPQYSDQTIELETQNDQRRERIKVELARNHALVQEFYDSVNHIGILRSIIKQHVDLAKTQRSKSMVNPKGPGMTRVCRDKSVNENLSKNGRLKARKELFNISSKELISISQLLCH